MITLKNMSEEQKELILDKLGMDIEYYIIEDNFVEHFKNEHIKWIIELKEKNRLEEYMKEDEITTEEEYLDYLNEENTSIDWYIQSNGFRDLVLFLKEHMELINWSKVGHHINNKLVDYILRVIF